MTVKLLLNLTAVRDHCNAGRLFAAIVTPAAAIVTPAA